MTPNTIVLILPKIEACGLWRGVYTTLTDLGYHVVLANPEKTYYIASGKKTDKSDSEILADLLRTGYLPEVYIPSEDVLKLRDIARHKAQLVRTRQRLQCMIKGYIHRDGIELKGGWNKENIALFKEVSPYITHFVNIIETINEQVRDVEREIRGIARNNYLSVIFGV